MRKLIVLFAVLGFFSFSIRGPVLASPESRSGSNFIAMVDSLKLLQELNKQFKVSTLIMQDYQKYLKQHTKLSEQAIKQQLNQIVAFYAAQLLRPVIIEINRISAEKRYLAVVNNATFNIEEALLSGIDTRKETSPKTDIKRSDCLKDLKKPFSRSLYLSNCQTVDITPTVFALLPNYFKANPLIRFRQK
jgi:hypothetical protein